MVLLENSKPFSKLVFTILFLIFSQILKYNIMSWKGWYFYGPLQCLMEFDFVKISAGANINTVEAEGTDVLGDFIMEGTIKNEYLTITKKYKKGKIVYYVGVYKGDKIAG